jgi:CPA1 family monovalent cation:H+ antiporter
MFSTVEFITTLTTLLLVSTLTLATSKRFGFPLSVALILIGILLNQLNMPSLFLKELITPQEFPQVVLFIFLPTLIFAAAFQLEARPLRYTLLPLTFLAVSGFLLFILFMGLLIDFFTPLNLPEALLLGVLLSATDPSTLIALLQRLSAPKRLILLLASESLFINAIALVVAQVLFTLVIIHTFSLATIWEEWNTVVWEIAGGLFVGWLAALVVGYVLRQLDRNAFVEISLTLILVYGTFLLTEEWLQLNGVMAIVAAGLTLPRFATFNSPLATQGITTTTAKPLALLWEYLVQVTHAMLFLMAGLNLKLTLLLPNLGLLALIIGVMLGTYAIVAYGLLLLLRFIPLQKSVDLKYGTVLYWGRLRGATTLAILFSLGQFPQADNFLTLVMGVVLFSALVQGLTLERLVHWLELDQPTLINQLLCLEGTLTARQRAAARIPEFQQGGLFETRIAEQQSQRCATHIQATRNRLSVLRGPELDPDIEQRLLFLRVFAAERNLYHEMFVKGHLSPRAYRNLTYSIDLQSEAIRHEGQLPKFTLHFQGSYLVQQFCWQLFEHLPGGHHWATQLRAWRTARDYEETWGRYQGNLYILARLDDLARHQGTRPQIVEKVRSHYRRWHDSARARIDSTTEQFTEFVTTMQEQLADRLLLHAEREAIAEQAQAGFLPAGMAQTMIAELDAKLSERT